MADNQKYYYMRLKENFFDDDAIKILESMQDGYLYSNILLKLYLKSLKFNGRLMYNERIPYNANVLATLTNHNVGVVEKALEVFEQLGLIEVLDNGAIYMLDIQNYIGKSSTEADRKREYRTQIEEEKQSLLGQMSGQMSGQISDKSTPEIEIELEKELDTDLETEKEKEIELELEKKNTSCPEPSQASEPEPKEPPIITLTLNTKEEYPIYQKNISEWQELYPAVDIIQELRKMKGWCNSNPSKRKTKNGICRFINGWLSREQDNGGVYRNQQKNTYQSREEQIANRVSVVDTWGFPEENNGIDDSFIH